MTYTILQLGNNAKGVNIANKLTRQNESMRYSMQWTGFEGCSQRNIAPRQHCKMSQHRKMRVNIAK